MPPTREERRAKLKAERALNSLKLKAIRLEQAAENRRLDRAIARKSGLALIISARGESNDAIVIRQWLDQHVKPFLSDAAKKRLPKIYAMKPLTPAQITKKMKGGKN